MNYSVKVFKTLNIALSELEPFIRDGQHLETGRGFKALGGMRSREAVANWLLCAVANFPTPNARLTFSSDPTGGDGIIVDTNTNRGWPTEHVLISRRAAQLGKDVETLISEAIEAKIRKGGAAYASGKTLVVFLNAGLGEWEPNRAAGHLSSRHAFEEIWVTGLQDAADGTYTYSVTRLYPFGGRAPTWIVSIRSNFQTWDVRQIQVDI